MTQLNAKLIQIHRLAILRQSPKYVKAILLHQGFAGEERKATVVQDDCPIGHGLG